MTKPFSQACANNQGVILEQLIGLLSEKKTMLEIGSGTGQHAVHFSQHLPHITWQTSDLEPNHEGIEQWVREASLDNCLPPLALDITQTRWMSQKYDGIFTANTLHICSWEQVVLFFQNMTQVLTPTSLVIIYGPFKYNGEYTSESNAQFDLWLKESDPKRGIRDFEAVVNLAKRSGLVQIDDISMPANNQLLVFKAESI